MVYKSASEAATKDIAQKLAASLTGGEVVTLSGPLGAGKTVFAKGFARGLKVTDKVTSPTFTIMNEYRGEKLDFYHYDAYRLASADEAYEAGLTDYFGLKSGVCLVEWAENIAGSFEGLKVIKVVIRRTGDFKREIEIQ